MARVPCTAALALALLSLAASSEAARLLPPAPPVDKDLVIVDWQGRDERSRLEDLAVRSLQGLVNRDKARVWVGTDARDGNPGWWLARYREMGLVAEKAQVITKDEFLKKYCSYAKGVVVPPTNLGPGGYRVAVMKAASDGLMVGTRELASRLGLKVVEDYSTRFKTYAESWRYALDSLWDRLSTRAMFVDREDLALSWVDYAVQQKLFLCAPHAGIAEEMKLFQETLSRLPDNSPVLGSAGGGRLCSEGDVVRAVSKAGCVFVGCSVVANLSVHSAIEAPGEFKQPMRQCPKLDRGKVYVAVKISDGDNANVYFTHIPRRRLWENRGKVPLGWTIGQAISELAPAIDSYYRKTRTPLDEFVTGCSGYAYMFPGDFGNALSDQAKEKAWSGFLDRTSDFLAKNDMKTVTTIQFQEKPGVIGNDVFSRYAKGLENASCIINGYNVVYRQYGGRTYDIVDGLPVFYTVTDRTWSDPGDKTLADEVIERTPKERPAFMALFMLPMALSQDHFDQVVESLRRLEREGYVLVLPSELAALARESQRLGCGSPQASQ